VNDGTMTSSPGAMSSSNAINSNACVPEVVSRIAASSSSGLSNSWHRRVKCAVAWRDARVERLGNVLVRRGECAWDDETNFERVWWSPVGSLMPACAGA